jgi:hypothetical protein
MDESPSTSRLPDSGMDTGSDAGPPGERPQPLIDGPPDDVTTAVADDAPLDPAAKPDRGGDPGDGLAPQFMEPPD